MTDQEKLKELFKEFGIQTGYPGHIMLNACDSDFVEEDKNKITLFEGNPGVHGYGMFFTEFCFDDSGKFLRVNLYE